MDNSAEQTPNDINIGMDGNNIDLSISPVTPIPPQNLPTIPPMPNIPSIPSNPSSNPSVSNIPMIPKHNARPQAMNNMLAQQHAMLMRNAAGIGIPGIAPSPKGGHGAVHEQPMFPDINTLQSMQPHHAIPTMPSMPGMPTIGGMGGGIHGGIHGGIPTMPLNPYQSLQGMNRQQPLNIHHAVQSMNHPQMKKPKTISLQSITRDTKMTFNRHTHQGLNFMNQQFSQNQHGAGAGGGNGGSKANQRYSSSHIALLQSRLRQLKEQKGKQQEFLTSPPKLGKIAEKKRMIISDQEKANILNRFEEKEEEEKEDVIMIEKNKNNDNDDILENVQERRKEKECLIGMEVDEKMNDYEMKRDKVEVEEKKEMPTSSNPMSKYKISAELMEKLMSHSNKVNNKKDDPLVSVIGNRVYVIPTVEELAASTDLFNNPLHAKQARNKSSLRGYSVGFTLRNGGNRRLINPGLKRSKTTFEPRTNRAALSKTKQNQIKKLNKDTSDIPTIPPKNINSNNNNMNIHRHSSQTVRNVQKKGSPQQSSFSLFAMKDITDPAVSRRVRKLSNNISLSRLRSYSCGALSVVKE